MKFDKTYIVFPPANSFYSFLKPLPSAEKKIHNRYLLAHQNTASDVLVITHLRENVFFVCFFFQIYKLQSFIVLKDSKSIPFNLPNLTNNLKTHNVKHIQYSDIFYICICLTNPYARAECDTISVFKQNLSRFNSDVSFSMTGFHTREYELSVPNYLPIDSGRIVGLLHFPSIDYLEYILPSVFIGHRIWEVF